MTCATRASRCGRRPAHPELPAAERGQSGQLDLLLIRYNAAHRGAETDSFPHTDRLGLPGAAYTALRSMA